MPPSLTKHSATTIGALATAPAPAGIAVIRVSGPRTRQALNSLFKGKLNPVEKPRRLIFGDIIDHETGATIDKAMAVFMPGPHSFTGEDVGEFQFHGSMLLVQQMLRSLFAFGVTPAEPGEFTKRAFLNGKMDLIQAEAVGALISATSDAALRIAGEQLKGKLSKTVSDLGEPLRDALAEMEAGIDFPEEGINPEGATQVATRVDILSEKINQLLESYSYGHVVREGFRILLAGRPNAGKSSLLNALLGKQRAIVSSHSGTTRDIIEEQASFGGFRFVLCDSAGIREAESEVERIGIELARSRISWADLILFVADATDEDISWLSTLEEIRPQSRKIWLIVNKIDLNSKAIGRVIASSDICEQDFYLSAHTGSGVSALVEALVDEVKVSMPVTSDANQVVTNERHRDCLLRARDSLGKASQALKEGLPTEIAAAEIRLGLLAIEELVGRTYTEDILGRIFSKFCVGK